MDQRPIGIFDSGLGGLTVADAVMAALPGESVLYFGDTARCPYGPQPRDDVRRFVLQIGQWLAGRDVKMLVVACNTGTAAGLQVAQRTFDVPVIGVIEPGARAAVTATRNRKVGVIGTVGTIESGPNTTEKKRLISILPVAGLRRFPRAFHDRPISELKCSVKYRNVTSAPKRCSIRAVSGPPIMLKMNFAQPV